MHKLMKEVSYDQITTTLLDKVHLFLFQYYTERLKKKGINDDLCSAFVEGLYHGETNRRMKMN